MRKINIDLQGYPNWINSTTLKRIANRTNPMAKLPSYQTATEPTKLQEEVIVERRYKELCDSYSQTFNTDINTANPMLIMMSFQNLYMKAKELEYENEATLVALAERMIREEYNLTKDEVLFDIELLNMGEVKLPKEMNRDKKVRDDFKQTTDLDALKKRTINALSQGASLKSHYMFHMHRDELSEISSELPDAYQKLLITNDLFYYLLDDKTFEQMIEGDDNPNNAGYVKLRFDGDIPVIEVKAVCFPILLHELTKGCISLFSIPGIQGMSQEIVDEIDFIMAEIYEIRLGPTIWQDFHAIIDPDDYDMKKHIMIELFKKPAEEFHEFMKDVTVNPEKAQREVKGIVRGVRERIMNYNFEKEHDDDLPDVDFRQFGF